MAKSPEQIIYDMVFSVSEKLGYQTFTYLPAKEVSYPFVFVGEIFEEDRHTKSGLFGDVQITVHVYHSYKERITVTSMLNMIKSELYGIKRMDNLSIWLKRGDIQLLIDDTMPEVLLHGMLELEFTFN